MCLVSIYENKYKIVRRIKICKIVISCGCVVFYSIKEFFPRQIMLRLCVFCMISSLLWNLKTVSIYIYMYIKERNTYKIMTNNLNLFTYEDFMHFLKYKSPFLFFGINHILSCFLYAYYSLNYYMLFLK